MKVVIVIKFHLKNLLNGIEKFWNDLNSDLDKKRFR